MIDRCPTCRRKFSKKVMDAHQLSDEIIECLESYGIMSTTELSEELNETNLRLTPKLHRMMRLGLIEKTKDAQTAYWSMPKKDKKNV